MTVLVTASARFVRTYEGKFWTGNPSLDYAFWCRYTSVFDTVHLAARAKVVGVPPAGWTEVTGPGVIGRPLAYYVGPAGFLRSYWRTASQLQDYAACAEAIIVRLPCALGGTLIRQLENGRPYAAEIVGDPAGVFGRGSVPHPLSPILKLWWPVVLRKQCHRATAVAYVTRDYLQERYPPSPDAYTNHYPSIDLKPSDIRQDPWGRQGYERQPRLIAVGSLDQLYKGMDVLIDAVALLLQQDIHLTIVGDGKYRGRLEQQAQRLGIANRITFTGQLTSREAVFSRLDQSDLFVIPSRTEGLPKALIEAMARGRPCIGSAVGAIPELLGPDDLVRPGDAPALAAKVVEVLRDGTRMHRMASKNLIRAQDFTSDVLQQRRNAFYRFVATYSR